MDIKDVQMALINIRGLDLRDIREKIDPMPVGRVYEVYTALDELDEAISNALHGISVHIAYEDVEEDFIDEIDQEFAEQERILNEED